MSNAKPGTPGAACVNVLKLADRRMPGTESVKVVADKDRKKMEAVLVDLSKKDEATSDYPATIVSALNPDEYEINIAEALA